MNEGAITLDHDALRQLRHDLRSPLLVITGFAQLLEGDVSDHDRRQYADRIQAAAEELRKLLEDAIG